MSIVSDSAPRQFEIHPIYEKALSQKRGRPEKMIWLKPKDIAVLIRKELKRHYPAVKFSVVSDRGAISVRWHDATVAEGEIDDRLACFESRFFCGNCDYGINAENWLLPDGTMTLADRGRCCCGRPHAEYPEHFTSDPPHPQALLVNCGIFIFARREAASHV